MQTEKQNGKAKGTVTEEVYRDGVYFPTIVFATPDGNRHTFSDNVGSSPRAYAVGEQVNVSYEKARPENAHIEGHDNFMYYMLAGFTVVFGGIGVGLLYSAYRRDQTINWLKQNGQALKAKISGVELNTSVSVNGRHPWRIYATAEVLGQGNFSFHSDNLWTNPQPFLPVSNTLEVLIDPNNPKRYWVDTSVINLPKEV